LRPEAFAAVTVPSLVKAGFRPETLSIVTQAFAHIVLVGIPMAYVAARYLKPR